MFLSIAQSIETDNKYNEIRTHYLPDSSAGERIHIAFGYVNSLSLSIEEANRLFLELQIALREAYDEEMSA